MYRVKLLPFRRLKMFGLGTKNTSYVFLAATVFLIAAGEQYYVFAAISAAFALFMAYTKISDAERELQQNWTNRDWDDRENHYNTEMSNLRNEIAAIREKLHNSTRPK